MKNILTYLFTIRTSGEMEFYLPLGALALLLIFMSIIFSIIYKKRKKTDFTFKKLFKHLTKTTFLTGFFLILYLIFRYEEIPYFSMRIWLYVILFAIIIFNFWYLVKYFKTYKKEKTVVIKKPKPALDKQKYTTKKRRK